MSEQHAFRINGTHGVPAPLTQPKQGNTTKAQDAEVPVAAKEYRSGVYAKTRAEGGGWGLVLVDPMNSRFIAATGDFVKSTVPVPENPANDTERLIARMSHTLDDLAARTGQAEPGLAIPIVVLSAGEPWWGREEIVAAWRESHAEIAAAREARELIVAEGSGHRIPEDRPDVVVDAVLRIVAKAAD